MNYAAIDPGAVSAAIAVFDGTELLFVDDVRCSARSSAAASNWPRKASCAAITGVWTIAGIRLPARRTWTK
jgi:hypothetical protein